MANQIKVDGLYGSQKQCVNYNINRQFNVERERGKMESVNHLKLVNCFTTEMSSDANYLTFFLKYGNFERE